MVRGIELFRNHFQTVTDSFVIIGGTACDLMLESAGFGVRPTKDIDMVLEVEAIDASFFKIFADFIVKGDYKNIQKGTQKKVYYRFTKPADSAYPKMIELFSRKPEDIPLKFGNRIIPVVTPEEISDLSAILMDDDYYSLVRAGKTIVGGLPVVSAPYLIPLKAHAWLNWVERRNQGHRVESGEITKHREDVCRLVQLLVPGTNLTLSGLVQSDFNKFLIDVAKEPYNTGDIGLQLSFLEILSTLRRYYTL